MLRRVARPLAASHAVIGVGPKFFRQAIGGLRKKAPRKTNRAILETEIIVRPTT